MPSDPAHIALASDADRDAVTALLVAQLREHAIETPAAAVAGAVERVLRHPTRGRLLVARIGETIVGVAAVSIVWPIEHGGRSAWLEELYVTPSERGRGIGRALLRAACGAAAEAGAVAVDLEVEASHERAARLYAREGFRRLERVRWVRALTPLPDAVPSSAPAGVSGGCFCGAVRYRTTAPPREVMHCHCGMCRRTTGAPLVTWATFAAADFAFVAGTPAELRSSERARREFCRACGTALTFREDARPRSVDVTVGSLDRPDTLVAEAHIWTSSALPWLHVDDDLPRHAGEDPSETDCT